MLVIKSDVDFTFTQSEHGLFESGVGTFEIFEGRKIECEFNYVPNPFPHYTVEVSVVSSNGNRISLLSCNIKQKYLPMMEVDAAMHEWVERLKSSLTLGLPIEFYSVNDYLEGFFPLRGSRFRTPLGIAIFRNNTNAFVIDDKLTFSITHYDITEYCSASDKLYPSGYDLDGLKYVGTSYSLDDGRIIDITFCDHGTEIVSDVLPGVSPDTVILRLLTQKHSMEDVKKFHEYMVFLTKKGYRFNTLDEHFRFVDEQTSDAVHKHVTNFTHRSELGAIEVHYVDTDMFNGSISISKYLPYSVDPVEYVKRLIADSSVNSDIRQSICDELSIEYDEVNNKFIVGNLDIKLLSFNDGEFKFRLTFGDTKNKIMPSDIYIHGRQGKGLKDDLTECLRRLIKLADNDQ